MKIALFCDSLVSKGGAERVVIQLANHLGADIITSGFNPELNKWMPIEGNIIDLGNFSINLFKPLGVLVESPIRFFLNMHKFHYDINIYSGFSSIYGSNRENKRENIWYCLSPNRILYDLRKINIEKSNFLTKLIYYVYTLIFTKYDQLIVKNNYEMIIAQTKNVSDRVEKFYNRPSKIIYSPVDTSKFYFEEFGDFYLSVSRFYPEKRISLIAKAFTELPQEKLIIVGDGPEKNKIKEIINKSENIQLLGDVNDEELVKLYATCLATIYIPINEDFGLVPLEGMASGKACIAVNEGGCKETVIDGKTGFLIEATEEDIIKAVERFNVKEAIKMKDNCLNWVKRFDINECIKQWKIELGV